MVAVLPPPVNGNTVTTKGIVDLLAPLHEVRVLNWSPGGSRINTSFRLKKIFRVLYSGAKLLSGQRGEIAYSVACDNHGLFFNLFTLLIARIRGYRIILHHHAYSYLYKSDWRMRVLDNVIASSGYHVFGCDQMAKDFRKIYDSESPYRILPNTTVLDWEVSTLGSNTAVSNDGRLRLGFISNITLEKGLVDVLETFARLREHGKDVSLLLAGPVQSGIEETLIRDASEKYPQDLTYLGPVYGEDKATFYKSIDVLLFPTRYKVEVQPLVVAEALLEGKPVIAYGRACIPELIGDTGGASVEIHSDFVSEASRMIAEWQDDSALFEQATERASQRGLTLISEAKALMKEFVCEIHLLPEVNKETIQ